MNYVNLLKELGLLSAAALFLAFTVNWLSPNGIALLGEWDTSKGVVSARSKNDVVEREREIGLEKAYQAFQKDEAVFVDARTRGNYNDGHIPGARLIPAYHFFERFPEFRSRVQLNTPVVTYCSGRECTDSHEVADRLEQMGYTDVRVFVDGFPAWQRAGYPVER